MTENAKGMAWMVLAMGTFALGDMIIKLLNATMPPGQILAVAGGGGGAIFALWSLMSGDRVDWVLLRHPASILRILAEIIATLSLVVCLGLAPLSVITAIMQANPLLVTLGAAFFLSAQVGPRRWAAILVGLVGVLLVIQPWEFGFTWPALLAVIATIGLSTRDLATRASPKGLSNKVLASAALTATCPAGLLLLASPFSGPAISPDFQTIALLVALVLIIALAYFAITASMRVGDVAVVTPFRYTRILFALILSVVVFDEELTPIMLIGVALIVGSGLFALWREQRAVAK